MMEEYDPAGTPIDGREGLVLFFTVGNHAFGVRLTEVSHIEPFRKAEGDTNRMSGVAVEGIGPEGRPVKAVDLRRFLGIEKKSAEEGDHILIIFGEGDDRYGLVADEVQAIVQGHQVRELTYPRLLGEYGAKVYGGFFSRGKKLILALNPEYIRNSSDAGYALNGDPTGGMDL